MRLFIASLGGIAATALAVHASGNITINYSNTNNFHYVIKHVPDFDQLRTPSSDPLIPGLPNSGKMYCCPTAVTNLASYISSHGYPGVLPVVGQSWWQWLNYGSDDYVVANIGIGLMGFQMQTDPFDGTGGLGLEEGAKYYIPEDQFCIAHFWATGNYAPTTKDVGLAACGGVSGSLVSVVVGWYESQGGNTIVRKGGHCLSLTEVELKSGQDPKICWRDPANTGNDSWFSQSPFASECYTTQNKSVTVGGKSRTMSKVLNYGSAYIDEYLMIRPIFGLTSTPALKIKIVKPLKWEVAPSDDTPEISVADFGSLVDVAIHPNLVELFAVAKPASGGPGKLIKVNPSDNILMDTGVSVANPKAMVFGRQRQLYVLDGTKTIKCVSFDNVEVPIVDFFPPFDVAAIGYDDLNSQLVALSASNTTKKLWILPYSPEGGVAGGATVVDLPGVFPTMNPNATSMAICPKSGKIYFTSANIKSIYEVMLMPRGAEVKTINHELIVKPIDLNCDNLGNLLFVDGDLIKVLRSDGKGGWEKDDGNPFWGVESDGQLVIARSRNNFDPNEHSKPEWNNNILPEEFAASVPQCMGDLNADDVVDGQDLGLLLAEWGSDGQGDLDDNDVVDGQDLGLLLADWGACP